MDPISWLKLNKSDQQGTYINLIVFVVTIHLFCSENASFY